MKNNLKSLWLTQNTDYPTLAQDLTCDAVIVGGGLTGLSIAYYLSKQNKKVVVLEAGAIGSGVSGHTTAHITTLHDLKYNRYIRRFGLDKAKLIAKANELAISEIKRIINEENIDCDFNEESCYLFTAEDSGVKKIKKELKAINKVGLNASLITDTTLLPVYYKTALKLENQAAFHPIKYLHGLAKAITSNGGLIFENSRALRFEKEKVATDRATVSAKDVVITSHNPLINFPGWYFAKMYMHRSQAVALKINEKINGIWNCIDSNGYTYRQYENTVIVGGEDNKCGCQTKTDHNKNLIYAAKEKFPGANVVAAWNAQDGITLDDLPYIGKYSQKNDHLYVATGFGKWGMTYSNLSGQIISDLILKQNNEFTKLFDSSRHKGFIAVFNTFKFNLAVLGHYIAGLFRFRSPRCSHMKCGTKWNRADKSWDCPCHGSRFTENGQVIDSPATHSIKMKNKQ